MRKNLTNKKFGKLTAIVPCQSFKTTTGKSYSRWVCKCDCGKKLKTLTTNLISGNTKSCGCLSKEYQLNKGTHKLTTHSLYSIWRGIKQRCLNNNSNVYKYYGGRGIKICDEWLNSPKLFIDWCISNGWKKGLQIDRIDNNGNYKPINCRFVTPRKNCLNKRILSKSSSNYVGVHFDKKRKLWVSQICINYKKIYLGRYKKEIEAVKSRNRYIIENNIQHEYKIHEIKL
jgi:hypothetical protein